MKKVLTRLVEASAFIFLLLTVAPEASAQTYCTVSSDNAADEWLTNVTFAGINNTSGSSNYTDYTSISGIVTPGVSYQFSGTVGLSNVYDETITVFIDWDQSGTFESTERYTIGSFCNSNGCILTSDIDVPATAIPGETRMRVILQYSSNITDPCGSFSYGEAEDYTINVESGECTPPNFTYTVVNDCEQDNYVVIAQLDDFGTSSFITVYLTRSDDVPVNPVTLVFALQGQAVNLINNVPFGVTVSASIEGSNPICNLSRNFAELICPAENDEACDAIELVCGDVMTNMPFVGATESIVDACYGTGVADVWFTFTSDGQEKYIISQTESDVIVDLWLGDDCGAIEQITACQDYPEDFTVTEAGTYFFRIRPYYSTTQFYGVSLNCVPFDCPELLADLGTPCDDGNPDTYEDVLIAECGCAGFVPVPGQICEVPLVIESMPYTTTDHTSGYFDDYQYDSEASFPPLAPGAIVSGTSFHYYMNGDDVVYSYTSENIESLDISVTNHGSYAGVFVFKGCAFESTLGYATNYDAAAPLNIEGLITEAGETYYIVISTWASPQDTPYTLSIESTAFDCPELQINFGTACDDGDANTSMDAYNENCECAGIPIPVNDLPCTATVLACGDTLSDQNMIGATAAYTDDCYGEGTGDIWYTFEVEEGSAYQVSEISSSDMVVSLHTGDECGNLTQVGVCLDYPEQFTATEPGTYFLRIRGYYNTITTASVTLHCVDIPVNDECADATELVCGQTYTGSTLGSAAYPAGQPFCGIGAPTTGNGGNWYTITPPNDTEIDILVTQGASYDTKMFLYSGACDDITCITGNYSNSGNGYPRIQTTLTGGTTYYVFIVGYSSGRFDYSFNISCVDLECSPTISSVIATDANGESIECTDINGSYYLNVTLEGGTQTSYNVWAGDSPVAVTNANSSVLVGPLSAGDVTVMVTGSDNPNCGASQLYEFTPCPPSNDEACDAITIACGETILQGFEGATSSLQDACFGSSVADVWVNFVSDGSQSYFISQGGELYFDGIVSLYEGDDCDNLTLVRACTDYPEEFTVNEAGNYFFRIRPYGTYSEGDLAQITLTCTDFDCADALANFGSACENLEAGIEFGVITEDCECEAISCLNTSSYPSTAVNPDATGEETNISTCQYWTEYATIAGVISGYDYEFTSEKNGEHGFITVRVGSSNGEVLASGMSPLTVTTTSDSQLYIHYTADGACNTQTGCAVTTVTCVSCANVDDCEGTPGGSAQPGTACNDGDPSTINDVWTTDCECAGEIANEGSACFNAYTLDCNADPVTYSSVESNATNATECTMGGNGIWFSFMGTGGDITINSTSTFDHEMSINSGECDALESIGCKDSSTGAESYLIELSVPGQMYYVYIAHYSGTSTTTGNITIDIDCADAPLCTAPELSLEVVDASGNPTSDCLDSGASFYVNATLSGGEGNDSYIVTATGSSAEEVAAEGSIVLGPFTAGTNVTVTAVGAQDDDCDVSAGIDSPVFCPPANDGCADAAEIACGETILGNTMGATPSDLSATCGNYTSSDARDLFYTFEADGTSDYTVSLSQPSGQFSFDGVLIVYSGTCDNLTNLDCSDSGNPEEVSLLAPAAGTYTIRLFDYSGTAEFTLSLECVTNVAFDCPDIQANIGDTCDDQDADTDNDVVTENCECIGTPIVAEFDCPELEANFGDTCELDNGMGVISSTCECVPAPSCFNFTYYLADHDAADGISDIYGVTLDGGVATMTYIATSDIEVHIAFNESENQIYAVSKHTNSYRTLDPFTGVWGAALDLGADYGEITAAVFNADGKLLIGSQNQNAIYSINVNTNVVSTYDTYSAVTGGDLAFGSDGMLYLATRSGNGLYQNWPDDVMPDILIGNIPSKVTGLAITDMDELLVSAQGQTSLELYSTAGANIGSYTLELDGEVYTLRDGDMASGCNTGDEELGDCDAFSTFYVNHGPNISGSNLYGVTFTSGGMANMTYLANVPYEAHIAFNTQANIVYLVNVDGSFVRTYNVSTDVFIGDLILVDDFVKITAAHYNGDDGKLYIGDHGTDEIYSVDLNTGNSTFYADGPVSGGDIVMNDAGIMYLATRSGAALYDIAGGTANLIGGIGVNVTGMAMSNQAPNLILSNKGSGVFTKVSAIDASVVSTYSAMLNGSPFITWDGDMASGCADEDVTPPVNPVMGEAQGHLIAYPNPTTGQAQVVFQTAETSRTLVEVYDMSGRNVATLFNAEANKGQEYRLNFDGEALPNGVYIYRMTTDSETIIEKFMIAK